MIVHGDLVFCGKFGVRSSVCPCPHLSSVRSHIPRRHVPSPPSENPLKFQNKPIQKLREGEREGHIAGAQLGKEGDYGGLWLSLILHFSSPQHLLSFPTSCQNRKSFHPKISVCITPQPKSFRQIIWGHGLTWRSIGNDFSPLRCLKYFWFDWFS